MLNKRHRPSCAWQEVIECGAYGNHTPLVLRLIIERGMGIHDVLAMRDVCHSWKRAVDAQNAYFERVCKHLKCARDKCAFFALYGTRTIGMRQLFTLCVSDDTHKRALLKHVIEAFTGWKGERLHELGFQISFSSMWYAPHTKIVTFQVHPLKDEDVQDRTMQYEFLVSPDKALRYRRGCSVWIAISPRDFTRAYVDFVHNV